VISRTVEAGLRGTKDLNIGTLGWKLEPSVRPTTDDILAIPSPVLQGLDYFQNVGSRRRQDIEAEITLEIVHSESVRPSYALVDARFLDTCWSAPNSPFANGDGNVQILPGNRIPGSRATGSRPASILGHRRVQRLARCAVCRQSILCRDESKPGTELASYAVFNLHASYQINKTFPDLRARGHIFDNRYATYEPSSIPALIP